MGVNVFSVWNTALRHQSDTSGRPLRPIYSIIPSTRGAMALAKLVTFSLMVASIGYWLLCIFGALKLPSRRPDDRAEAVPPATGRNHPP